MDKEMTRMLGRFPWLESVLYVPSIAPSMFGGDSALCQIVSICYYYLAALQYMRSILLQSE